MDQVSFEDAVGFGQFVASMERLGLDRERLARGCDRTLAEFDAFLAGEAPHDVDLYDELRIKLRLMIHATNAHFMDAGLLPLN